jgi:putative endonuclease
MKQNLTNAARGLLAEAVACSALLKDGWIILGRRLRTQAGEIDMVANRNGVCAFIEVKLRPSLSAAAWALGRRQQARLMAAAEILLGTHPEWGQGGVRFDVLLVDPTGQVRRVTDAFRAA